MKATELRLGNYVMNLEGEISKITGISDPIISTEKMSGDIDAWTDPIPLTEEWLLKFGFEKMSCITFDHENEWVKNPKKYGWEIAVLLGDYPKTNPNCGCVSILNSEDKQISATPPDLYEKEHWTKEDEIRAENYTETLEKWRQPIAYYIKYVHQLQNLYFALTGEELIN